LRRSLRWARTTLIRIVVEALAAIIAIAMTVIAIIAVTSAGIV
jgi:hypothetical protein